MNNFWFYAYIVTVCLSVARMTYIVVVECTDDISLKDVLVILIWSLAPVLNLIWAIEGVWLSCKYALNSVSNWTERVVIYRRTKKVK